MNNNPFEQPTNPPANPSMPPSTQPPVTPPPANPFAPPPASAEPRKDSPQQVPIISKNGPGSVPPGNQVNNSDMNSMYQPAGNEPASGGKKLLVLIIVLVIILVLGGLFFASWEGWISLGGIEKYWKPATTTNTNVNKNSGTEGNTSTVNANDQQRKTDLSNIKTALTAYYQANQSYPVAATVEKTSDSKNALTSLVPTYLASLPVDPLSPTKYYGYQSDGKTYTLTAVLEDTTDPLGIQVGSYYIYKVTNTSVETPQATNSNTNSNSNSSSSSSSSSSANANANAEL